VYQRKTGMPNVPSTGLPEEKDLAEGNSTVETVISKINIRYDTKWTAGTPMIYKFLNKERQRMVVTVDYPKAKSR
jgi:hypothetical protein